MSDGHPTSCLHEAEWGEQRARMTTVEREIAASKEDRNNIRKDMSGNTMDAALLKQSVSMANEALAAINSNMAKQLDALRAAIEKLSIPSEKEITAIVTKVLEESLKNYTTNLSMEAGINKAISSFEAQMKKSIRLVLVTVIVCSAVFGVLLRIIPFSDLLQLLKP